eukprot:4954294-Prorocentrum_lima.AAC.1
MGKEWGKPHIQDLLILPVKHREENPSGGALKTHRCSHPRTSEPGPTTSPGSCFIGASSLLRRMSCKYSCNGIVPPM